MASAPAHSGPGFIDGRLEESLPLWGDEVVVYNTLPRLVPPRALAHADHRIKVLCIRGYHKEKPRAETTAAELTRIMEWREANSMDEVRAAHRQCASEGGQGCATQPCACASRAAPFRARACAPRVVERALRVTRQGCCA